MTQQYYDLSQCILDFTLRSVDAQDTKTYAGSFRGTHYIVKCIKDKERAEAEYNLLRRELNRHPYFQKLQLYMTCTCKDHYLQ